MNGEIEVTSEIDVGTTFLIKLPITQNAPSEDITPSSTTTASVLPPTLVENEILSTNPDKSTVLPQLLIVEYNPQIVQILVACLEDDYLIQIARNGQEGIDKAIELVPDLILSDVMMPLKTGFELCATLKQDERTSHIPIILLTAKADLDSKISGLEHGADAYLSKPFDQRELLVRLRKLLELRQKLQAHYRGIETETIPIKPEDPFVQKVRQAIEANIDNERFGIAQLCRTIGLSRAQLHNKIKALTGLSTSIYIRSIRLKKAKILLETTDFNVTEVAFEVGFKSPNYFSTAFMKEFGVSPSGMKKKQ